MAVNAICGRTCSVTVQKEGGYASNYDFHNAQLSLEGIETDVTAFGSGIYGDWVTCGANATLTAGCYDNILGIMDPGDEVTVVLTLGYEAPVTVTCAAKVSTIGSDVDAKGIVMNSVTFRLTGDPVIA